MKIWGFFLTTGLLFVACTNPNPKPHSPNVNWMNLDEPPLFSDCPQDDAKLNWDCFSKVLKEKLDEKWNTNKYSFDNLNDTIYVTIKVDTLGQISVLKYKNNHIQISPVVLAAFEEVIATFPLSQPAFKTNLEVPVEVQWTLPVAISK